MRTGLLHTVRSWQHRRRTPVQFRFVKLSQSRLSKLHWFALKIHFQFLIVDNGLNPVKVAFYPVKVASCPNKAPPSLDGHTLN